MKATRAELIAALQRMEFDEFEAEITESRDVIEGPSDERGYRTFTPGDHHVEIVIKATHKANLSAVPH